MLNLNNLNNLNILGGASGSFGYLVRKPLTTSLLGTGPDITFGRATTHGVIDCYGAWHNVRSGEARFYGARRVQNLARFSETFTSNWSLGASNVMASVTGVTSLATGRESIKSFTRSTGTVPHLYLTSTTYRPGQHTFSIWAATTNGTDTLKIRIERSSDSALVAEVDVVPPAYTGPSSMRRYAVFGNITDTTNHRVYVSNVTTNVTVTYLDAGQMEYTHNNGTGAPNEYIATDILSAPYYGANVDQVCYKNTYNGNTLSSGLVVEATGASIPSTVIKGLLNEPGSSNGVYSSRDIGAAEWTKTSATAASAMINSGTLGYQAFRKLEEAAATANHRFQQLYRTTTPADNARIAVSAYVKAGERDIVYIGYIAKDGTEHIGYFNLTTLGVTLSSGANEEGFIYAVADGFRINLVGSALTGGTAMQMIGGVTTTAGTTSYLGTLGSGAYFGGLQMEVEAAPTQYKADTGSAAIFTTNDDNAYYTIGTTLPTDQWEVGCDASLMYQSNSTNKLGWAYLWYSNANSTNRFGTAVRPGTYGGFNDAGADDWVFDLYPNSASWNGVDITQNEENTTPLTTKTVVIQMHTSAKIGASNLVGKFGSTNGYNPAGATQAVNTLPTTATIRFGHNESNTGSTNISHSYCIKNYYVKPKPKLSIVDAVPSILTILAGYLPTFTNNYASNTYQRSSSSVAFPHGSVRTTNATMFDSQGRLVWAPANMLLYSDDLTNAYWTKTDTTLSQDGTLAPTSGNQAYLATEGSAGTAIVTRQTTVPASTPFSYVVEIKKGNHQFARIGLASGAESCMAWVDFDNGTITNATLGGTTTAPIQPSITALANGWFRVIMTAIFPVTNPACFCISALSSGSSTRVSGGTHYLGRFNIELYDGTSPKLPNVITSGTAYYGARLDYDPSALTPRGLLVEGAVTNTIANTQNIGQLNGTIGTGDSYLGYWVSKRFTADGTSNAHLAVSEAITPGVGEVRNVSAIVKMISGTRVQLATSFSHGAANVYANFNLSTGTLVGSGAGASNIKITHLGNSVYRLSLNYTTTAAVAGGAVALYTITSDSDTRGPTNSSTDVFDVLLPVSAVISFETSVIPAFGASATRAADNVTETITSAIKNTSVSYYVESYIPNLPTGLFPVLFQVDDGTSSNRVQSFSTTGATTLGFGSRIDVGGANQLNNTVANTISNANLLKCVGVYTAGSAKLVLAGGTVFSGAPASVPAPSTLRIGGTDAPTANARWIEEIRFYQTATVSDAEVQAITV